MSEIECFDRMEKIDDSGHDSVIYRVSENKCVKILRNSSQTYKLKNELKISKILFENGVSVPRPYGEVSISSPYHGDIVSAFIMEYIDGRNLRDYFGDDKYLKLLERVEIEYEKVKKLKIYLSDTNLTNSLYSEKKDKIYLIDFCAWRVYQF